MAKAGRSVVLVGLVAGGLSCGGLVPDPARVAAFECAGIRREGVADPDGVLADVKAACDATPSSAYLLSEAARFAAEDRTIDPVESAAVRAILARQVPGSCFGRYDPDRVSVTIEATPGPCATVALRITVENGLDVPALIYLFPDEGSYAMDGPAFCAPPGRSEHTDAFVAEIGQATFRAVANVAVAPIKEVRPTELARSAPVEVVAPAVRWKGTPSELPDHTVRVHPPDGCPPTVAMQHFGDAVWPLRDEVSFPNGTASDDIYYVELFDLRNRLVVPEIDATRR